MAITNKSINLKQLDAELGGYGLCGDFNDENNKIIVVAENSPVTDKELDLAIKNHIAQPTDDEIRILNRQEGIAKLKELGFTDEQISALLVS